MKFAVTLTITIEANDLKSAQVQAQTARQILNNGLGKMALVAQGIQLKGAEVGAPVPIAS